MKPFVNTLLTVAFVAIPLANAHAVPTLYNSEAAFLAAIGGSADISEDFNSYVADQPFRNASFDVGPFTLSSSGNNQNTNTQNTIDTSPFAFGDFADVDDTPFAHFFLSAGVTTASIAFDSAITAFGATFRELSDNTSIEFTTQSGAQSLTPAIGLGVAFFGFVLDPGETLTGLTFVSGSSGDGFGMDNVLLSTQSVPEPGVLGLMTLGLVGVARRRHRRAGTR